MSWLAILPILIPLFFAALMLFVRDSRPLQRSLAIAAGLGAFVTSAILVWRVILSGTLVSQMGAWPAPFGISFVADRLSSVMTLASGALVVLSLVYSTGDSRTTRAPLGFYSFLLILLAGVNGAFLTGDLFNLYVWFEVLLVSSLALLLHGNEKAQLRGAIPYLAMNLVASALALVAIGLIYGMTGSLNMAELSRRLSLSTSRLFLLPVAILFLTALGLKAALFPLFFWLPKAYPTLPASVLAAFSGLQTKVAIYAIIRFVTLFLAHDMETLKLPLLGLAAITMVSGVLGAAAQNEFRKILSFHMVSQIGYMIMGLALFTPLALAGTIYFMLHNVVAKSNLFLISGVVQRLGGSFELKKLGGFYRSSPSLSLFFLLSAFSLAGLPPLSGFWGKFILAKAGLEAHEYAVVAVSLIVGLLTLFSMMKIWIQVFWKTPPEGMAEQGLLSVGAGKEALLCAPICALAVLTIALGVFVEPVFRYLTYAAEDLLDPSRYVAAVLGGLEP